MDRSNVSFLFQVKDPESGELLHETSLSYNNLPYAALVEMQKILVESGQKLTKLGEAEVKKKK